MLCLSVIPCRYIGDIHFQSAWNKNFSLRKLRENFLFHAYPATEKFFRRRLTPPLTVAFFGGVFALPKQLKNTLPFHGCFDRSIIPPKKSTVKGKSPKNFFFRSVENRQFYAYGVPLQSKNIMQLTWNSRIHNNNVGDPHPKSVTHSYTIAKPTVR